MRVHDKELFNSHCPYTDELCDSWECDTCEVEQEELQMRKELYKDGENYEKHLEELRNREID